MTSPSGATWLFDTMRRGVRPSLSAYSVKALAVRDDQIYRIVAVFLACAFEPRAIRERLASAAS